MATIIVDTRQQEGKHDGKHSTLCSMGHSLYRSKLIVGDYAPPPSVSVDTKKDLYELASDIDQQHDRFRQELMLARDIGCHLYILTINGDGVYDIPSLALWCESNKHYSMRKKRNARARRIEGERIAKACETLSDRYGVTFLFCSNECECARWIDYILGGGYDG